jgi:hypothetical protein
MSEPPTEQQPAVSPLDRIPRRRESPWPVVITLVLLALLVVGGVMQFFYKGQKAPWEIDYPGVTWLRGVDNHVQEGKRYLIAEVRFNGDVLSGAEFDTFLAALLRQTGKTYFYYKIVAQNGRGQRVLIGFVDNTGRWRVFEQPEYLRQGQPEPPGETPEGTPDNAPDESPGETIIIE